MRNKTKLEKFEEYTCSEQKRERVELESENCFLHN